MRLSMSSRRILLDMMPGIPSCFSKATRSLRYWLISPSLTLYWVREQAASSRAKGSRSRCFNMGRFHQMGGNNRWRHLRGKAGRPPVGAA